MHIILASSSPRRRDLLALLQIPFSVVDPGCDESIDEDLSPREFVVRIACQKVRAVAAQFPKALVLGGDTVIEMNGEILGKPRQTDDAATMLKKLAGNTHQVHTGIALFRTIDEWMIHAVETVQVSMKPLTDQELDVYLKTSEGLGKAGGYCIQGRGADLIAGMKGDYPAVVGFPLRKVAALLEQAGIRLPMSIADIYRRTPYPNWEIFTT